MKKSTALLTILLLSPNIGFCYSLDSDLVEATITASYDHTLLSPFNTSSVIVGPDSEFTGELRYDGWNKVITYNVIVNIENDYFTIDTQETNNWFPLRAFTVNDPLVWFEITLNDLNGGESITSVIFNDSQSTQGLGNPTDYINFTNTSITLGFDKVGSDSTYHFDINPVPIPASIWPMGSALLGLMGVSRNRARITS